MLAQLVQSGSVGELVKSRALIMRRRKALLVQIPHIPLSLIDFVSAIVYSPLLM